MVISIILFYLPVPFAYFIVTPLESIIFVFSFSPMVKVRKKITGIGCNSAEISHGGYRQGTGHVN